MAKYEIQIDKEDFNVFCQKEMLIFITEQLKLVIDDSIIPIPNCILKHFRLK